MIERKDIVVIVGCSGVGSNLAYLLSKEESISKLVLIDGDKVERKNLARQFFTEGDIEEPKVLALKNSINQFAPELNVIAVNEFIKEKEEISLYFEDKPTNNCYLFICTDNADSKKILSKLLDINKLFIGCEQDITELRTEFKSTTWNLGDGYDSTQDFEGNLIGVFFAYIQYKLITARKFAMFYNQDINKGKLIDTILENNLKPTYDGDSN